MIEPLYVGSTYSPLVGMVELADTPDTGAATAGADLPEKAVIAGSTPAPHLITYDEVAYFTPAGLLEYKPVDLRIGRRCNWCGRDEDDEDLKDTFLEPEFHYFHDLCDRCHLDILYPDVEIGASFYRGCTPWSDGGFEGLHQVPLLCVLNAPTHAWRKHGPSYEEVNKYETWLFFRNRAEWNAAWRIARRLLVNGNNLGRVLPDGEMIAFEVALQRDLPRIAGFKLKGENVFYSLSEDQP